MASQLTPGSAISRISQTSTASLIAAQLREAIATGEYAPGQQVQEVSLAGRLGVSRGPLREAMQRLTQEGLLVSHRNRGLFVMDLDEDAVRDIYLARGAIERAAVQAIIERGGECDITRMREIVAAMASYDGDPSSSEVSALDMRFHKELVTQSRSPRLALMHDTLLTQVRLCLATMESSYDSVQARADEHGAIAEALVAGDAELADRLLVDHMDDGLRRLVRIVDR